MVPVNHVKESSHLEHHSHAEKAASSNSQEDTPKKSFASIVSFNHLFLCISVLFMVSDRISFMPTIVNFNYFCALIILFVVSDHICIY